VSKRELLSEATWTAPRPDCPRPELWHAPDDESTEVEVSALVAGFVRALQPDVVVETGSGWGQTSEAIGLALAVNEHGRLWTLETNPARAEGVRQRCLALPVTIIERSSLDWLPPGPISFAWIDSALADRVEELGRFRQFLPAGAIVGVHDTGPQHGIRDAVEAIDWIRWLYLPSPRGVSFGEVLG